MILKVELESHKSADPKNDISLDLTRIADRKRCLIIMNWRLKELQGYINIHDNGDLGNLDS